MRKERSGKEQEEQQELGGGEVAHDSAPNSPQLTPSEGWEVGLALGNRVMTEVGATANTAIPAPTSGLPPTALTRAPCGQPTNETEEGETGGEEGGRGKFGDGRGGERERADGGAGAREPGDREPGDREPDEAGVQSELGDVVGGGLGREAATGSSQAPMSRRAAKAKAREQRNQLAAIPLLPNDYLTAGL